MLIHHLRNASALALAFLALLAGCAKVETKPEGNTKPAPAPAPSPTTQSTGNGQKSTVDTTKGEPTFQMTAQQFHDAFKKDPDAAREKFGDELIVLKGVVGGFGIDFEGDHVNLKVGDEPDAIKCFTRDKAPWAKLFPGQSVTIRGRLGIDFGPVLYKCTVVEAGPGSASFKSASDLAKEFAADRDKTEQKYNGKHLYIEGEVIEKKKDDLEGPIVILQGTDKIKIECTFSLEAPDLADTLEVGKKVKLFGRYDLLFSSDNGPRVSNCLPFPK